MRIASLRRSIGYSQPMSWWGSGRRTFAMRPTFALSLPRRQAGAIVRESHIARCSTVVNSEGAERGRCPTMLEADRAASSRSSLFAGGVARMAERALTRCDIPPQSGTNRREAGAQCSRSGADPEIGDLRVPAAMPPLILRGRRRERRGNMLRRFSLLAAEPTPHCSLQWNLWSSRWNAGASTSPVAIRKTSPA